MLLNSKGNIGMPKRKSETGLWDAYTAHRHILFKHFISPLQLATITNIATMYLIDFHSSISFNSDGDKIVFMFLEKFDRLSTMKPRRG